MRMYEMEMEDFVGKKLLNCEYQLKAFCAERKYTLAIMEKNDVNIDVEPNRLCCVIDDNGVIQGFSLDM